MRPAPSPARSCPGAPLPTATSVGAIKRSSGAVPFHQGCRSRGTGGPMAEASRCSLPRNAIRRRAHQPTAPPDFLGDLPRGGASVRWPRPAPPSVTRNVAEPTLPVDRRSGSLMHPPSLPHGGSSDREAPLSAEARPSPIRPFPPGPIPASSSPCETQGEERRQTRPRRGRRSRSS